MNKVYIVYRIEYISGEDHDVVDRIYDNKESAMEYIKAANKKDSARYYAPTEYYIDEEDLLS